MLDLLKRTYLMGLGLASITREKIEEVVDELVSKGEVAEKDRPRVIEDLLERAREEQKKLGNSVGETVQRVIAEIGLPSRAQFDEILKRLEKLERRVQAATGEPGHDSTVSHD